MNDKDTAKKPKYKRLTYNDRLVIETMLACGKKQADIARYLGVTRSTICKEIKKGLFTKRNTDYTESQVYAADVAQRVIDYGNLSKGKELKIGNDYELLNYIYYMIKVKKYSPEATLAEIKRNKLEFKVTISLKTLYRYIEKGVFLDLTIEDLPMARKKKKRYVIKRGKRASAGTSIEKRPDEVDSREDFGHWEMDTVKGKRGKTKSCMLVLSERKTRREIVRKMKDQKAASVVKALDDLEMCLKDDFPKIFKSITVDNGVEFADNIGMSSSIRRKGNRTEIYYCHAYSSYERGTNENQNRLVRRHIPKGVDFDNATDEEIKYIEEWMNAYPRKIFGYETAEERYIKELKANGIDYVDI